MMPIRQNPVAVAAHIPHIFKSLLIIWQDPMNNLTQEAFISPIFHTQACLPAMLFPWFVFLSQSNMWGYRSLTLVHRTPSLLGSVPKQPKSIPNLQHVPHGHCELPQLIFKTVLQ